MRLNKELENFNKILGKNIRKHRIDNGKATQKKLAQFVDVQYQAVWMWENGKVNISSYHLFKLAQFFGVSVNTLLPQQIKKKNETKKKNTSL